LDDDQSESIKGFSACGYLWKFSYPDSLYDLIWNSYLFFPGTPDSVEHRVGFNLVLQGDTMQVGSYYFGRHSSFVKARYLETNIAPNIPMTRRGTDEVILGTSISDSYDISTDDQVLVSFIKQLHGGYGFLGEFTYEETMRRDMEFIRQNPNFRGMMISLANNMRGYESKADIAEMFNCFSEDVRQSYYGQKVSKHLEHVDTLFKNQILPTWDTGLQEAIIQDSSKFNLIVFSASWCGPCHRMIPFLKEIFNDLGRDLIMTYVSIDTEKYVENWQKVMRENKIPWRSLIISNTNRDWYDEDYALYGVPYTILVHPLSMKKEMLDVRREEDRQRLYELLK
jgi:thiol-disulfide isomerase/thioredoxin